MTDQSKLQPIDYWRFCDALSVIQAALLIVGVDPSTWQDSVEGSYEQDRPVGYTAVSTGLKNSILGDTLEAQVIYEGETLSERSANWHTSKIKIQDLKDWLTSRGIATGFFFPVSELEPDYLDINGPRYAPKLAAAVRAWQAVTDPGSKSPKQALIKWLREHAAEFGLTDDDGNPNGTGIEEIAKVANWAPDGGAPRTPGQ